jgi:hypothetical protein
MKNAFLAAALLGLLTGTVRAEDNCVVWLLEGWSKIDAVTARLRGRILGSLVRKGMTYEQVDQLLGGSWANACSGTIHTTVCISTRLGIVIVFSNRFYKNPKTVISRVIEVDFPWSVFK